MLAAERENLIVELLHAQGSATFREIFARLNVSEMSVRRDLERLAQRGLIERVHGGARLAGQAGGTARHPMLTGVPLHENMGRRRKEKEMIGRAAAQLCRAGEAIIVDGGSTTLQMSRYLAGLNLQVLTNSLHVVSALITQQGTRISVPSGTVFPEQNIILSTPCDNAMLHFHAPKLFMGAAAVGPRGAMQTDMLLASGQQRFINQTEQVIVLADSSKFGRSSGSVACPLERIDTVITDAGINETHAKMLEEAGVGLIIAH